MNADSIFIAGPTASGKSALALALAERLDGEIISVDSMQVYQGLDLGTAKPSHEERLRIRHHLLDVVEISEPFDAARFVQLAREAETTIRSCGKVPIFCGGTGLYFNALIEGLPIGQQASSGLRNEIEKTPLEALLAELQDKDPITFERIDRANPRRVIRAIEILRVTGAPIKREWTRRTPAGQWIGLERPREALNRRIDQRVDRMFHDGLIAETEGLLLRGLGQNPTAQQAIGYRQVIEHLHGARSLTATVDLVKQKTRQYAKRQGTWFRRQLHLRWIEVNDYESTESLADSLLEGLRSASFSCK